MEKSGVNKHLNYTLRQSIGIYHQVPQPTTTAPGLGPFQKLANFHNFWHLLSSFSRLFPSWTLNWPSGPNQPKYDSLSHKKSPPEDFIRRTLKTAALLMNELWGPNDTILTEKLNFSQKPSGCGVTTHVLLWDGCKKNCRAEKLNQILNLAPIF